MLLATPLPSRPDAVEQTLRAERQRLLDFIRRRVRTREDAEDIIQDVFYQLVASYSVTEPVEQLTAWLFAVARNKIIDWYRKRRPESWPAGEGEAAGLALEEALFDPSPGPDQVYTRSLVWEELAAALDELPEKQREVFVQHELEGRSFKELADQTGESINTLLSRKRYAVLYLRDRLREWREEIQHL
ncbi:MAG: RNA polymerase sigma factor [Candidatus Latescibacteria bacterium]|nr:RNA polymerase sigma factor [Candidatus Latescibacterota bacterium]